MKSLVKDLKLAAVALVVIAGLWLSNFLSAPTPEQAPLAAYNDQNIVAAIREDCDANQLPIEVVDSIENGALSSLYYEEYAINGVNMGPDYDSFKILITPEVQSNPYVIAHEFGHYIGYLAYKDTTEEFANTFAYRYVSQYLSPEDVVALKAAMALEGRGTVSDEYFDQVMKYVQYKM